MIKDTNTEECRNTDTITEECTNTDTKTNTDMNLKTSGCRGAGSAPAEMIRSRHETSLPLISTLSHPLHFTIRPDPVFGKMYNYRRPSSLIVTA